MFLVLCPVLSCEFRKPAERSDHGRLIASRFEPNVSRVNCGVCIQVGNRKGELLLLVASRENWMNTVRPHKLDCYFLISARVRENYPHTGSLLANFLLIGYHVFFMYWKTFVRLNKFFTGNNE